jgi:L-alanine-DL-glutamate epimerase-like enolase superfamily enzyme
MNRFNSRRSFLPGAATVSAATIWSGNTLDAMMQHVNKGFITVPDKPGLGITLNDEVMKQHLLEPTLQWDKETGRVS